MAKTEKEIEIMEKRYNDLSIEIVNGQTEVSWLREIWKNLVKENKDLSEQNISLKNEYDKNIKLLRKQEDDFIISLENQRKEFEIEKLKNLDEIEKKNKELLKNIKLNESNLSEIQKAIEENCILIDKIDNITKRNTELDKKQSDLVIKEQDLQNREQKCNMIDIDNKQQKNLNNIESTKNSSLSLELELKQKQVDERISKSIDMYSEAELKLKQADEWLLAIKQRESDLSDKELSQTRLDKILSDREKELIIKEKNIIDKELTLESREREIVDGNIDLQRTRLEIYTLSKKAWLDIQLESLWLKLQ